MINYIGTRHLLLFYGHVDLKTGLLSCSGFYGSCHVIAVSFWDHCLGYALQEIDDISL